MACNLATRHWVSQFLALKNEDRSPVGSIIGAGSLMLVFEIQHLAAFSIATNFRGKPLHLEKSAQGRDLGITRTSARLNSGQHRAERHELFCACPSPFYPPRFYTILFG